MERSQSEKQYLLALITAKKQIEAKLVELKSNKDLWTSRLKLAREHNREDLITAAEKQLAEIEIEIPGLESNILMRQREIDDQRSILEDASIDDGRTMSRAQTQALVDQLEIASGQKSGDPLDSSQESRIEAKKTADEIESLEADIELQKLRKKMKEDKKDS